MKKSKKILAIPLMVLSTFSVGVIAACSTTDTNSAINSEFQKTINELFANQKLEFKYKQPIISKQVFEKYKNDLTQMKLAFVLENKSDLKNLDFEIQSLQEDEKNLNITIIIKNEENQLAQVKQQLYKSFAVSEQDYAQRVYDTVGRNLKLKPEYQDKKLIDLLSKTQTVDQLLDLINQEQFLGIKVKYFLPTQNVNLSDQLKINMLIFNDQDQPITIKPTQYYLNLNPNQINPITIIKQSDLNNQATKANNNLDDLRSQYFGQTFILKDETKTELNINKSFSSRNIVGPLDFSAFDTITFNTDANFSANEITDLKFKSGATVKNLKENLFTNNKMSSITLDSKLEAFSISAFDATVEIKGLEKQSFISPFYDATTKDLYLNKATSEEQVKEIVQTVQSMQKSEQLNLNNVYLPVVDSSSYSLPKISAKKIIFNQTNDKAKINPNFNWNLSNWEIKESIEIPDSVLLINKYNLPSQSSSENDKLKIHRTLNQEVLNLIKDDKSLDLNQKINLLSTENSEFKLINNQDKLDQLFWTFDSENEKIKTLEKIILDNNDAKDDKDNHTLTLYDLTSYFNTFIQKSKATNKTIEVKGSKFTKINFSGDYSSFKSSLESSNIKFLRIKPTSFNFIDEQGKLKLDEFYKSSLLPTDKDYLYQYLIGLEDSIKSIDVTGVTQIEKKTFYQIPFKKDNNVSIDLSKITKVRDSAFYSVKNLTFSNWNTTQLVTIENYAFYSANIGDNVKLDKATKIGDYAFAYNTLNTSELDLSQATDIGANAFYSTQGIQKVKLNTSLKEIKNSAFYGAGLTSLTVPTSVTKIGDNAFSNNNISTTNLDLSNVEEIGSYAFSNNYKASSSKDAVANPKTNGIEQIKFKANTKINSSAFDNAGLKTLDLKDIKAIGNNAFTNNSNLTTVSNFPFDSAVKITSIFSSDQISKINFGSQSFDSELGYNSSTKVLDLKSHTNWSVDLENKLTVLLQKNKEFKEVILPNTGNLNPSLINLITNGTTIEKLTWNATGKTMDFQLSGKNIKSLDSGFLAGMQTIPDYAFTNLNLTNINEISLVGITNVGQYAFSGSGIKKFKEANELKEIKANAFDYDAEINLPADVKIAENAFNPTQGQPQLPAKVTRNQIFSTNNKLSEIYDQKTKVLDFTKSQIGEHPEVFFSKSKWEKYLDAGQYLLDGDVKEIVLPNMYIIWDQFVNDLGHVNKITFQSANQQINENAFTGTTVDPEGKPQKEQTNIIFDGAKFFS